ncbi:HAD family hydrolase [Pseudotabrizicola algicola]|uniref:HAD family phosphatase n=1 Tax=Pseudotabrizicola algicola TaxID=2709381 RepID=A0A6B3RR65_9RHOB|nr:HAD family phosphatase [Pseudotabrizicola algicola]NEX48664.1 HAD family phosphatase [Pseudotabrizicola algicola]
MRPLPATASDTGMHPLPAALLFDCDGTLVLTADLHYKAISLAVARQGHQMPRDWYMSFTGLGRRDLFRRFAAEASARFDMDRLVEDSVALTVDLTGHVRENPLVAGLARRAFGRLPMAVVINSEGSIARAVLAETRLSVLFDCIVTVEDAQRPKPAPDLYLAAAARLGAPPSGCLVLEDSDQGIDAARSAGMMWADVRSPDWPDRCNGLLSMLGD